jgi:superfamily II RNA helicase
VSAEIKPATRTLRELAAGLLSQKPGAVSSDQILEVFLDWVTEAGLELYPAQEEAILEVLAGKHVILNTPTGSGKSLVAVAMHLSSMCRGRRSFYTCPIKALVSEKFFALCRDFGPENVGMMTGDASVNRDAPIICCTAEILANMALRDGRNARVDDVIMDEFHYYSDRERGIAWQIPLLTLPYASFMLMSATLGDTSKLEESLSA